MSMFKYNNIEFVLTETRDFNQTTVFSEDGADALYYRVHIEIAGTISPGGWSIDPSDGANIPGLAPGFTYNYIKNQLMQRDRPLLYQLGYAVAGGGGGDPEPITVIEYPVEGQTNTPDGMGTRPLALSIQPIGESQCFHVNFKIEVTMPLCTDHASPSGILSLRFTRTHTVGPDLMTQITTTGVVVFDKGRLEQLGKLADDFRRDVIPGVPSQFRREHITVRVSSVGNTLYYETVDKEQYVSIGTYKVQLATFGVLSFSASETVGVNRLTADALSMAGPLVGTTLVIRAEGARSSQRSSMALFCMRIAINRLQLPGGIGDASKGDPIIQDLKLTQDLNGRTVQLEIQAVTPPVVGANNPGGFGGLTCQKIFSDFLGIESADMRSPNPEADRGSYKGLLFSQILQSPCDDITLPNWPGLATDNRGIPAPEPATVLDVNVFQGDVDGTAPSSYSNAHTKQGAFTTYYVATKWKWNAGVVVQPTTSYTMANLIGTNGVPAYNPPYPVTAPPASQILNLACPSSTRTVTFVAERVGAQPLLPMPDLRDPNTVLLDIEIDTMSPTLNPADATNLIYRLQGRYEYAHLNAVKPSLATLACGVSPLIAGYSVGAPAMVLGSESFVDGIIEDSTSAYGGSGGTTPLPPGGNPVTPGGNT